MHAEEENEELRQAIYEPFSLPYQDLCKENMELKFRIMDLQEALAGITGSTEAAEHQLAHVPPKLQQSYQRDDLLPQRRALLTDWRDLISGPTVQTPAAAQEALGEPDVATSL